MKLNKSCATCEFYCHGKCGGGGGKYSYGDKITDKKYVCGAWGRSLEYHLKVVNAAPPHLKELYDNWKITWEQLLSMIE